MTGEPGLLQRLTVLTDSFDRRRLKIGFDLLCRHGLRVLVLQLMVHTAYRWRLRRLGVDGAEAGLALPADESKGPFEPYREGFWPEEKPLVSVVIPRFNDGALVAEVIDSVLAQTFQDVEIIIVDGGPTNTLSRRTVAALRRPRTLTLFRDASCSVGDNRNFGIHHAHGKYICCVDTNHILEPTYLEKAVFLMETGGYDLVSTSVKRPGGVEGSDAVMADPVLSDMLEGNQAAACAVFRRSLWQQAGGFKDTSPDMPFVDEDWRFWVRLAALGARVRNISGEHLVLFRVPPHSSFGGHSDINAEWLQAPLMRELNKDVVTPAAFECSRTRAAMRLRSLDGTCNLIRRTDADQTMPTILLAFPYLVLGGAERLLSQVAPGLRKSGFRIVIVTTVPTWPHLGDTTSWFEPATSEIYHLPRFLPRSRWLEFIEYLIDAKRVNALLIVGSLYFYDIIPGLKAKHPDMRVADLLFNAVAHADNNRSIAALLDVTLVEGEKVRSCLLARGEKSERICLIPSGIDLQRFRPTGKPPQVIQELGFSPDAFIVGFSGRLAEEKAPLSFLRIAASFAPDSPIRFVMTGTGPLEEKVHATLRRNQLGDRLHFAGMIADIRDYLGCYDVLVLPSIFDGRPTVVMEALAMGIPVVASAVGSLPDLVIHGETGFLCKPTDPHAFASHIQWLYDHPREHARMRRAARHFAEQHFRLEPMVSSYVHIFDRLTGNGVEQTRPATAASLGGHAAEPRHVTTVRSVV